jgi:hypothetical protein
MSVDSLLAVLRDYQGIFGGVLGGVFTLVGGALAYCAVRRQIRSNERIAETEARATRQHLYAAAGVELREIHRAIVLGVEAASEDTPADRRPDIITQAEKLLSRRSTVALEHIDPRWDDIFDSINHTHRRIRLAANDPARPETIDAVRHDILLVEQCVRDQILALENGDPIERVRKITAPLKATDFATRQKIS